MGSLRKVPSRRGVYGRQNGLNKKDHVREQDTGKAFGRGGCKAAKPLRPFGKGV